MTETQQQPFTTWLRAAGESWYEDNVMRMSSSLAYYTLLSLAPILLLAISIAGFFLGDDMARYHIAASLTRRVGYEAGSLIEYLAFSASSDTEQSLLGTLSSLVVLFVGASAAFGELQSAMNTIWAVQPRPGRRLWGMLRDRFVCFTMVGSVALILILLMLVGAVLALLGSQIGELPGGTALWQVVDFLLTIVAVTLLLALCYKTVPDVKIPLREIWPGAILTAVLFTLGELALAVYLRFSMVPKPQGAAGAIIVLVMWVYYSGQIVFFGAEFIKVCVAARGVRVTPRPHAVRTRRLRIEPEAAASV